MQLCPEPFTTSPPPLPFPLLARGEPPPDAMLEELEQQDEREREPASGDKLLCRQCLRPITSPKERIQMQGSHLHTVSNPAGLLFRIGCFRRAKGCEPASLPEAEWSWFRGYLWQVVQCSACATHMGWRYSGKGDSFYGLILDRLVREG